MPYLYVVHINTPMYKGSWASDMVNIGLGGNNQWYKFECGHFQATPLREAMTIATMTTISGPSLQQES